MNPKLKMICDLYDKCDESIDVDALLFKVCFFKDIKEILELLSYKQCVRFAYLCAESVLHLVVQPNTEEKKCLKLVKKWLEGYVVCVDDLRAISKICDSRFGSTLEGSNPTFSISYCADIIRFETKIHVIDVIRNALKSVKDEQKQKYKNLGFLIKVIRDEPT